MNKPHKSRNSEPNEQSPRNIFEIFSCSWAPENFSRSRGLRTDISPKTVVGCPWLRTFRSNKATATRTSLLSALKQLFLHSYFVKCRQTLLKVFFFFFNPGSERDVKFPRRLFTIAIKRKIRHFHVVVVWKRQRNVQKSVTHVQTFFLAYWSYNCFLFVVLVAVSLLDLRPFLHGVWDPCLVGLVSFVFTLWGTQNKRNLPH